MEFNELTNRVQPDFEEVKIYPSKLFWMRSHFHILHFPEVKRRIFSIKIKCIPKKGRFSYFRMLLVKSTLKLSEKIIRMPGGPKLNQMLFLNLAELKEEFKGFDFFGGYERKAKLNRRIYHVGEDSVSSVCFACQK